MSHTRARAGHGRRVITGGHDGNIWATLFDGDSAVHSRVTRLDGATGAVVAGYPKPTGGDRFPGPIAIGADGDVWISDGSSGQVSRLAAATGANRPGYRPSSAAIHDDEVEILLGLRKHPFGMRKRHGLAGHGAMTSGGHHRDDAKP